MGNSLIPFKSKQKKLYLYNNLPPRDLTNAALLAGVGDDIAGVPPPPPPPPPTPGAGDHPRLALPECPH